MRILITGGTGLIGRHLCKALLAEGHQLTVLSRQPETVAVKCGAEVQPMASLEEWRPDRTFDAVINLAGEPIVDETWKEKRKQVLRDSRIALTEKLVQCITAAKQKPSVLLSGSAVGFYGNGGDKELYESASAGNDFAANLCRDWENAALAAKASGVRPRHGAAEPMGAGVSASHLLPQREGGSEAAGNPPAYSSRVQTAGFAITSDLASVVGSPGRMASSSISNVSKVRVCLLRTGLVLSKNGGLLGKMLLPFKLGMGARLGNGKQWMSWVHIDDYVAMVLRLLQDGQMEGSFNMTAPNPVTNAEFTRVLARTLHRPALFIAPGIMLRLAMGERAALLLEGQRVLPANLTDAGYLFKYPELSSALDALLHH